MIAIIHGRIDEAAKAYPERVMGKLRSYLGGSEKDLTQNHHSLSFLLPAGYNYSNVNAGAIFEGLSFLLNKQFKDGISQAVQAMEWPANSISMADRDKELQKLDKEIEALSKEEASLNKHAAEAGIIISL